MSIITHRTKIVATIGPASNSPEVLKQMIGAGMNVARLNFSHGSYEDHARVVTLLRQISQELDNPITLLQDLQGPKIRVGHLPNGSITINDGDYLTLVPMDEYRGEPNTVSIDYPYLAEEAQLGEQILLDDGLLELKIGEINGKELKCQVLEGGILKSRKGVNLPRLNLRLPSMTEKDKQDLEFGLSQGVDWVSLSFVRKGEDIKAIKAFLAERNHGDVPVIAKIEKPQAIENLESIVEECDGIMVARGDLGVELSPEKVPMLQKRIIKLCNMKTIPVITATQMLESMIHNPRPTRAEASDVANAIIDGTDAVMLSGESAVGDFPVKAVAMLAKIAHDVEADVKFDNVPPNESDETHALSEALVAIDQTLDLRYIVTFTTSGYTSLLASKERPSVPVIAMTPNKRVYHRLNLVWGVIPILLDHQVSVFEDVLKQTESILLQKNLAQSGDKILIMAGIPMQKTKGTNFLKIHTIS
ncbi:MAG: pyruvate kinase [Microcystis viridis Mv_BB_P_19951000_S69]|uniref:Pyruvate kinase n=1 Tax=Microcystis viridis Mv_BB_P_19951000_S68D TaxID=2486270 RepID=A0A552H5F2_MICVR|nr:pyruvate kinase [Microcystis aeruginosa]TRU66447.1 MAG: pyruvate kinase [Microcystis viridis Mv_BB_P_19951000_S68D]TRU70110.1 MAG: pyruvate kinase [Microcystis viridis Mv_BB_P_19951000_S69]TRU76815.1 MAG: pyruvate kinase [Microcystis viridis Mv_BB_P_19951000_S68]TRU84204.1 MAG: pyruvate kinase [Microcystis viridis Mv_BB_P_19951000_S69D]MDB9422366.1 pyruvate kinase [Microcystis aeruginosa CS-563/04]